MTINIILSLLFQITPFPEQVAFDYFMEHLFTTEYSSSSKPGFKGFTETHGTFFDIVTPCFTNAEEDKKIHAGLYKNKKDTMVSVSLDIVKWKKKFKSSGKNEIKILRATMTGDRYYVEVIINYESKLDCYFIEMDERLKVIRHCKTGLVY